MLKYLMISLTLLSFILITGCGSNSTSSTGGSTAGSSPTITRIMPLSAPVGSTVIITGTNFSTVNSNNAVRFNGTTAVVTSCTSTQIIVAVPTGATTGPLTVTIGDSTATSTVIVTIPTLASIAVYPVTPSVALGVTAQFEAIGSYSDGSTRNLTSAMTWGSTATNVATISVNGLVNTVAVGTTTISATSGLFTASTVLTVTAPITLVSIEVTPNKPGITLISDEALTATGTYSDGTTKDITSAVAWFSADSTIALFSSKLSGDVLPVSTGTVDVSAYLNGILGSATLTVTSASNGSTHTITHSTTTSTSIHSLPVQYNTKTLVEDDTYCCTNISIVRPPANGTVTVNGLIISYTPNAGYIGSDTIVTQELSQTGSITPIVSGNDLLGDILNINTNTNTNTVTVTVAGP